MSDISTVTIIIAITEDTATVVTPTCQATIEP